MIPKYATFISKLFNYGIKPEMLFVDSIKIYVFNLIALIGIPLQLSGALYHLLFEHYILSFTDFLNFPILLMGYLSIKVPNLSFVRSLIIFLTSLLTIYASIIHHHENEFVLIALVIVALMVYDSFWLFIIHLFSSFTSIIFIRFHQLQQETFSHYFILQNLNFIISIIILASILILVKLFYDKNSIETVDQFLYKDNFYKGLIENAFDGVSVLDDNFNTIYRSPGAYRFTGWTNDEINDKKLLNLFHPDDVALMNRTFQNVKANPNTPSKVTYRLLHKKGNYIWLNGHFTNINIYKNKNIIVINFSDITEQKLAQDKLSQSEVFYRTIFDTIAEGISIVNKNREVIFRNNSSNKILGKIINRSGSFNDVHPDDREYIEKKYFEALQNPATSIPYEVRFRNSDGQYLNIEGDFINLLLIPEINGTISTYRDITARKRIEQEIKASSRLLQIKSDELENKNKELSKFTYIAAHDLQEPLRMSINFLQLFERKYKDIVDENGKKYIQFAVEGSLRMNELILDLLKYSKLESNQLEYIEIDMNEIMKEIIRLFQNKLFLTKGSIKVINDLPVIKAVKSQMLQIMQNLIGNALKFKGVNVPLVTISSIESDDEWIFSVKDNGIGIDPVYTEKIFEVFQRLHRREEFEGTGIGLAICKKIIDQYQGRIWVESVLGEGACFKFSIPKS
jgi:PAS domain S-box-containing protein